ncbi:MAG TPA: hypothetical protein VNW90_29300, partial [Acetobacteraceae bacterium]|nr:hypothetical protein [Acetobacteraceae bacterium]
MLRILHDHIHVGVRDDEVSGICVECHLREVDGAIEQRIARVASWQRRALRAQQLGDRWVAPQKGRIGTEAVKLPQNFRWNAGAEAFGCGFLGETLRRVLLQEPGILQRARPASDALGSGMCPGRSMRHALHLPMSCVVRLCQLSSLLGELSRS